MISWVTMRLPRKPRRAEREQEREQDRNRHRNRNRNRGFKECNLPDGQSTSKLQAGSSKPVSGARVVNINIGIDRCLRVHGPDARTRIALRSTDPSPTRRRRSYARAARRAYAMPVASRFFLKMFSWTVRGRKGERSCQHVHRQTDTRMHECTNARMQNRRGRNTGRGGRTEWNVPFTKKEAKCECKCKKPQKMQRCRRCG